MQKKLATRANLLSRRIYASLPWGYRLARFLVKLAGAPQKANGVFFHAEFIKAGVLGMPDLKGKPAETYHDKLVKAGGRAGDVLWRIDSSYGADWGEKLWATLVKKFKNTEIVEDAIADYRAKVVASRGKLFKAVALSSAQSFVLRGISNAAIDIMRKTKKEQPYLVRQEEGETVMMDVEDPSAWRDFARRVPSWQRKRLEGELAALDRKHPEWGKILLQMKMDGATNVEIADAWGVSKPRVTQWLQKNRKELARILSEHLEAAG